MIVHLSTVHPRHDVRILIKEINSAKARLTHDVVLVVADAMGDDQINLRDGIIQIFDVGKSRFGHLGRIFVTSFRAFVRSFLPSFPSFFSFLNCLLVTHSCRFIWATS